MRQRFRGRLTEPDALAGVQPTPFTREDWDALYRASLCASDAAARRHQDATAVAVSCAPHVLAVNDLFKAVFGHNQEDDRT